MNFDRLLSITGVPESLHAGMTDAQIDNLFREAAKR